MSADSPARAPQAAVQPSEIERRELALRVYAKSVQMVREAMQGVRCGRPIEVRRVKRSVQALVDQVLGNEAAILNMTALHALDENTFSHSVNVCILALVVGQRLGLDKRLLYELGLCGLLHDLGKMGLQSTLINKPGRLTEEEWGELKKHPRDGVLALFRFWGAAKIPFRQMLAAYEHHMKIDQSGYPEVRRHREVSLFSRIVSVVDVFDAVTSVRSYRSRPWSPDVVLRNMRDDPNWGLDRVIVKAFIQVMGIYPVGSVVVLDNGAIAVVAGANRGFPDRPVVVVVRDPAGRRPREPVCVDLADDSAPSPVRIERALERSQHDVDIARYVAV